MKDPRGIRKLNNSAQRFRSKRNLHSEKNENANFRLASLPALTGHLVSSLP
jgi:hypothetical protein